jgi:hypothetical protein
VERDGALAAGKPAPTLKPQTNDRPELLVLV